MEAIFFHEYSMIHHHPRHFHAAPWKNTAWDQCFCNFSVSPFLSLEVLSLSTAMTCLSMEISSMTLLLTMTVKSSMPLLTITHSPHHNQPAFNPQSNSCIERTQLIYSDLLRSHSSLVKIQKRITPSLHAVTYPSKLSYYRYTCIMS